jgi:hypothetical protein
MTDDLSKRVEKLEETSDRTETPISFDVQYERTETDPVTGEKRQVVTSCGVYDPDVPFTDYGGGLKARVRYPLEVTGD